MAGKLLVRHCRVAWMQSTSTRSYWTGPGRELTGKQLFKNCQEIELCLRGRASLAVNLRRGALSLNQCAQLIFDVIVCTLGLLKRGFGFLLP